MKNITRIIIGLLLLLLVTGNPALISAHTEAETEDRMVYLPLSFNNSNPQRQLGVEVSSFTTTGIVDKAVQANVYWLRRNGLLWSTVQPDGPSQYLWDATLEAELIQASNAGFETILVVRSTPTWAQMPSPRNKYCAPMDTDYIDDFAYFMQQAVSRYSAPPYNVRHYELWNEPDVEALGWDSESAFGCWGDHTDPYYGGGYYAEMLKQVYPAVKAANPFAQVLIGGLLLDCDPRKPGDIGYCSDQSKALPPKFFEGILVNGGGPYFDTVSFHGYPTYKTDENPILSETGYPFWSANGGVVAGKINYLRAIMVTYGLQKPILHTEAALLYFQDQVPTEAFQQAKADYVVWLFARNWAQGLSGSIWYTLNGPGWRGSGLLDAYQQPLPAYETIKYLSDTLAPYNFRTHLTFSNGVVGFEFINGASKMWLLFKPGNEPLTLTKPSRFVAAYDLYGNPIDVLDTILIDRPTYIELSR
jgi:hypothetical protein